MSISRPRLRQSLLVIAVVIINGLTGAAFVDRPPVATLSPVDFSVRARDVARPLLARSTGAAGSAAQADSALQYSTLFGGIGAENISDMAVGADGSLYVAGYTTAPAFLPGPQPYDRGDHSNPDAGVAVLIAKFAPGGRELVYATVLSAIGYSEQWATGIAVDETGAAYVTGTLNSGCPDCNGENGFPTTPGAYQTDPPAQYHPETGEPIYGTPQLFVLKLDPSGTTLVYSTLLGGADFEDPGKIALGPNGTVFVTGTTYSPDFETTTGQQAEPNGDGFLVQLNATGTGLVASRLFQGSSWDRAGDVIVRDGGVYVVGWTTSTDLVGTSDLRDGRMQDNQGGYVARVSVAGLAPEFLSLLPTTVTGLALDAENRMFVIGDGRGRNLWTSETAFQKAGFHDGYVALLSADGAQILKATYIGGAATEDRLYHIALTASGEPIISGYTFASDYPTTAGAVQTAFAGQPIATVDGVVSRFSADLSALTYSTYLGGTGWDMPGAMAAAGGGSVWIAGETLSPDFPVTPDAMKSAAEIVDAFLVKLDTTPGAAPPPVNTPAGGPTTIDAADSGASVTFETVATSGTTTVQPVNAASLDLTLPGGFALSAGQAYEIQTTAAVTGITVCLSGAALSEAEFSTAVILHGVNGAWQAEPTTRNAATRELCATVASLSPFAIGVVADAVPPAISCAAPPLSWSAVNLTLACTAEDAGIGLANAADAAFSLQTDVPIGVETADATTNAREVCDEAGNCAVAMVAGIRIDRKAPSVAIAMPAEARYLLNQVVPAAFTCTDGGALASCVGTTAQGSPLDTATAGPKTLSVRATDAAGNTAEGSRSYVVGYGVRVLTSGTVKKGKTLALAIQLTDASGANVSSSTVVVTARTLRLMPAGTSVPLQDSPQLNPDHRFRFGLGAYGYALDTKGMPLGTYELQFTAGDDPALHTLRFQVTK